MYRYRPQGPAVQQVNLRHSVPLLFGRYLRSPGSNLHSSCVFGAGDPWFCRFGLATLATGLPPTRLASIAMPIVAASSSCYATEAGASRCPSADGVSCRGGAAAESACYAPAAAATGASDYCFAVVVEANPAVVGPAVGAICPAAVVAVAAIGANCPSCGGAAVGASWSAATICVDLSRCTLNVSESSQYTWIEAGITL